MDVDRCGASGSPSMKCLLSSSPTDTGKKPNEVLIEILTVRSHDLHVCVELQVAGSAIRILKPQPGAEPTRKAMALNLCELRLRMRPLAVVLQGSECALEKTKGSRS